MSASKPIPAKDKAESRQEMTHSLPNEKTAVFRVASAPIIAGDTSSFGAELRRRSDNFFKYSFESLHEGESDQERIRRSTMSSDDGKEGNGSSASSPEKLRIDAWFEWRNNKRRNSSPVVTFGRSQVGSPV